MADNFFAFRDEVNKRLRSTTSVEERLLARTTVGQEQFGARLQEAGLIALEKGQSLDVSTFPNAIVLGVATWSNPDMDILSQFYRVLRDREQTFILDIDHITNAEELHSLLPSVPRFGRTPVLAQYSRGALAAFTEGPLEVKSALLSL